VALPWLLDQGRARVVSLEPGAEDEGLPWFAPVRGLCRDNGVPLGRRDADLVLDLDPDARPARGEGVMVRVLATPGAPSPDINRAILTGGRWAMVVTPAGGDGAWAEAEVEHDPGDDGASLMDRATLRGVEALADSLQAILDGTPPTPLATPLRAGRWRAQESFLNWHQPAGRVFARLRAAAGPWGGARTQLGETSIRVQNAVLLHEDPLGDVLAGTILDISAGIDVACGRGAIRLLSLSPGYRPPRSALEYAAEIGLGSGYMFA
jgi:hypothetical protein